MGQASSLSLQDGRLEACPTKEAGPTKTRRRRRWLVPVGALAVVVLVPVGWGVYHSIMADRRLNAALDEVSRADPGWTLSDIEAARKTPAPDKNSGRLVLAVSGRVPRLIAWTDQDLEGQLEKLPPQVRLNEDQHCRVTADLADVDTARILVGPLADMPEGRYTISWSRDYIGTRLPHLDAQNRVRQLLWHDLMLRAEEDDADGALADCRRLLNLARSFDDEPLLVTQRVRNNVARSAVRAAERVLAQGEPSDAALDELQRGFAAEDGHPGLVIGLRGERAGMDGLMALIQAGDFPWQQVADWTDRDDRNENETRDAVWFSITPGAEKESRAAALRQAADLIAAARLPEAEQSDAFARIDARRKELPLLARQLTLRGSVASWRFLEGRAELRCAVAALAAERYRRRHGSWPERLDELVPDLMEKVPADPFPGRPLRLRRLSDGIVIYSVGSSGQDDGSKVDDGPIVNTEGAKNIGFRLWDVSHRRQAPPEPDIPDG